jgi:hypothetical protein
MAVFSRLLLSTVQFVYGAYAMARQSFSVTLFTVNSMLLHLVQMDDMLLPEVVMGI